MTEQLTTHRISPVRLVKLEWAKLRAGRTWWGLLLGGSLFSALTSYGFAKQGHDRGVSAPLNTYDLAVITGEVSRAWMMVFLFAAICAALAMSREYSGRTLSRTALLLGPRTRILHSKIAIAFLIGLGYGLVALLGAIVSPIVFMPAVGLETVWTASTTLTAIGVFASCILAAVAGLLVAVVIRNPIGSAVTILGATLLVDPGLQRLVPDLSKFLYTIALSSIYQDDKPELLGPLAALLVIGGWLMVLGFFAYRAVTRRDID